MSHGGRELYKALLRCIHQEAHGVEDGVVLTATLMVYLVLNALRHDGDIDAAIDQLLSVVAGFERGQPQRERLEKLIRYYNEA